MKKIDFIVPTIEKVQLENIETDDFYCKLKITPLERGYGMTLGNSLRRVLLSSLPGAAAVAMRIEGVHHEFQAIDGVVEDVTEIILNLKQIIFTINADKNANGDFGDEEKLFELTLNASLPSIEEQKKKKVAEEDLQYSKEIKASDLVLPSEEDIKVINPDQVICTVSAGGSIDMTLLIRNGVGYVSQKENGVFCTDQYSKTNGFISIDSIFTPVSRCKYEVSKTRFEDNFDCDQLILEVWTDGSMIATNAVSLAAKFLVEHFNVIANLNTHIQEREYMVQNEVTTSNDLLDMRIEDLELTIRSYHCLKKVGINTVGELVQKTEEELMKLRNFGRKSIKEVILSLHNRGLDLKNGSTLLSSTDDEDEETEEESSTENEE